jgi:ABC-type transporter Mla maintaining outer membrane lipid asymmetry permease subunit MlaE
VPSLAARRCYLLAYVALRLRVGRRLASGRFVAAVVFALLLPVAVVVPALVALALVATVWVALHAYEIIWWHDCARRNTGTARASLGLLNSRGM